MACLVFPHAPNREIMSHDPDSTDWAQVTLPTGVPTQKGNVNVVMKSTDNTDAADGGLFLVAFDEASAPTHGFPVSAGQALSTTLNVNIWIKLTTATDEVKILFLW